LALLSIVIVLALLPQTAGAQGSHATDPSGDSPSGAIYEIPLERARDDAAPRGDGRGNDGPGSGGRGTDGSGAAGPTGSGGGGTGPGATSSGDAGADGPQTSIHSENGFGSSTQVPGVGDPRDPGGRADALGATASTDGAPSEMSAFGLIAILTLTATVGGAAIARNVTSTRRRP
jgi:hypothetical protein